MLTIRSIFPLLIGLTLLSAVVVLNLNIPTDVQARPLAGFTPDPGDDGDDGDDGDGVVSDPSPRDNDGRAPTDYVLVRLDQCDMTCGNANANMSSYEPLAYHLAEQPDTPLLIPITEAAVDFEIIAPVRMVHNGSGFIAVGDLSTQRDTRISVPYPGEWEIFMTGEPRFMTAEAMEVTGTNLAQLEIALSEGPVPMGVVEANTAEAQLVKCPIACVIDPPAPITTTDPPVLPETGGSPPNLLPFLLILGLALATAGWWAMYLSSQEPSRQEFE